MGKAAVLMSVAAAAAVVLAVTPPAAAGSSVAQRCATDWGSRDKTLENTDHPQLVDIRSGRHECFDRLVFDVRASTGGPDTGYRVRYVKTLHQFASGEPIHVDGGAILEIVVAAPSYDIGNGEPTYDARAGDPLPGIRLDGYRTFRDTRFAAGFEGETQIGLGVRARLPFRVFQTADHLVVDVAHTW